MEVVSKVFSFRSLSLASLALLGSFVLSFVGSNTVMAACAGGEGVDHWLPVSQITGCTNLAPADGLASIRDQIMNQGWYISYTEWLSVHGRPTTYSIDIPYGSASVPLQYNAFVYRQGTLRSGVAVHVIESDAPELRGRTLQFSYPNDNQRYRVANVTSRSFNYVLPESIKNTPGRHKIVVSMRTKGVQRSSNGRYVCVKVGNESTIYTSGYNDYGRCSISVSDLSITVTIGEPQWSVNGQSYVQVVKDASVAADISQRQQSDLPAFPGNRIYWWHDIRNNGPHATKNLTVYNSGTGFGNHFDGDKPIKSGLRLNKTQLWTNYPVGGTSDNVPWYSIKDVPSEDIGKRVCENIKWSPGSSSNGGVAGSTGRCVNIRSDFNLYPKATINGSELGTLSYGSSVDASNISEVVNNTGSSADKDRSNNDWVVYQFKVPSSSRQAFLNARATIFNQSENGYKFALGAYTGATTGCAWLKDRASYVDCLDTTATGSQKFLDSSTSLPDTKGIDSASFDVGDLVCRIVTVKDYNHKHNDANERRISYPACVTIAKTPWVQIWGGDVRVGSAIGTNSGVIGGNNSAKISTLSTTQENLYGSWGEYGMVAPTNGTISSASAGAFSGATGGSIGSNRALLSFANTASVPGRWANYTTAKIPNFGTATQTLPASTSSINVGSYPAGTTNIVRVQGSNVLNLSGTLQAGTTLIINTSRTVTITGNITYARQTIGSAQETSQLVIAAQNINIAENVTEVNGWLIATPTSSTTQGVISTCGSPASPYYTGLRSTNCDKKLTINGAITARQLQLRRTAGAEKDNLAAPAEVINQRADIFLWASSFATRSGLEMETAATMEAAPRF